MNMDISRLDNLHVQKVFVGTGIESILNTTTSSVEFYEALFEEMQRHMVWVTDDSALKYCVFVTETANCDTNKLLKVINSSKSPLYLWRIDGKMFPKYSKCDCALFQDGKFFFVEFKANAISQTPNSQEITCEKACEQLQITFEQFCQLYEKSGISFRELFTDIKAMVVLNKTIPRDTAFQKNLKSTFLKNNKVILEFGNEKSF